MKEDKKAQPLAGVVRISASGQNADAKAAEGEAKKLEAIDPAAAEILSRALRSEERPFGKSIAGITFDQLSKENVQSAVILAEAYAYFGKFLSLDYQNHEQSLEKTRRFISENRQPFVPGSLAKMEKSLTKNINRLFDESAPDIIDYLNRTKSRNSAKTLIMLDVANVELSIDKMSRIIGSFKAQGKLGKNASQRLVNLVGEIDTFLKIATDEEIRDLLSESRSAKIDAVELQKRIKAKSSKILKPEMKIGKEYKETVQIGKKVYDVVLKPQDIELQLDSLSKIHSCFSPGSFFAGYRSVAIGYISNPNTFFGVIMSNNVIRGRFTVCIGEDKDGRPAVSRISKVYMAGRSEAVSESEPVDSALKNFAKVNDAEFIREGRIKIARAKEVYDDFVDNKENTAFLEIRRDG